MKSSHSSKMDGGEQDDEQSSEGMISEMKEADTSPSSSEDHEQASDKVELSSKLKEKCFERASKKQHVDALLEEEVSRNNRLKKRNKEIQDRLQKVVKLYTSLIERQRIVFLISSREPE